MHLLDRVYEWRGRETEPLTPLYWNIFLRGMGMSMVGLFTPVFIFLIGRDMAGLLGGVRLLAGYLLIQRLLLFLLTIPIARVVYRLGFRFSVLLGSSLTVIYYFLPVAFDRSLGLVAWMALVTVFSTPFYWLSRHSILALDGVKNRLGTEVGIMNLLERGGAVLAPVVGGVIAQVFGFKVLFGVGMGMILLSSLPLFFMQHHEKDGDISWDSLREYFGRSKKRGYLLWAFAGEGLDTAISGFFWPVYVFLIVGSLESLGGLTSAAMLISLLASFFAGRAFDKQRSLGGDEDEKSFWLVGGLFAFLRLMRAAFASLWGVFGLDMVTKILAPYYWVPFGGYLYSAGKKGKGLKLYVAREMSYSLAVTIFSLLVLWISVYWWRWWGIFGVSALGILLTWGMAKES